ncbi:ABC transporter substrate-binding protein [Carnobacterium mobile]|uniref:ABC transporter substrate-binding protein n=1 Tax=Carnobacterium mobile TaxID=2750 RepID=UPI0005519FCD|nr:extracellular solute-binding protein [Carnobacterium mobile]
MKLKKRVFGTAIMALLGITLVGCGSNSNSSKKENGKTEVTFWAAPNPPQLKYWKEMAAEFEKTNPDIDVVVTQMKESPSSEATIQSAVASKTAPTMSENINRSFGAQLAESEVILPLNKIEGFSDIVSSRNMNATVDSWEFSDGSQYILPVYSNPIMFAWRTDVLKDLGYSEPPKTYSELVEVGKKLKEKYPEKVIWAKSDLSDPTGWMRWFDFFPLYDAATEGNSFIEDNKLTVDDEAGVELLTMMADLQKDKLLLAGEATDPFENQVSIMADLGPWAFPNWEEKFPELVYGENYTVASPVVPDSMADTENVSTYADAKGIVMYTQATEEEQKAAVEFLKFVYGDVQHDVELLETTSLIPARDDSTENEAFADYFKEHPEMKSFAESVKNAVPAMDNANYNELQQIIGESAWNPIVRGEKTPEKAWKDMKAALEGVLKE